LTVIFLFFFSKIFYTGWVPTNYVFEFGSLYSMNLNGSGAQLLRNTSDYILSLAVDDASKVTLMNFLLFVNQIINEVYRSSPISANP